jgi:uncharacterized protein (TIGR02266 family)
MQDPQEKRRAPRFPLILQVGYRHSDTTVLDCTENLSAGGLFIRTEFPLAVGARVPLILSFPGLLEPLEIEVEVVRRRERNGELPGGVAVKLCADNVQGKHKLLRLATAAMAKDDQSAKRRLKLLLIEDNQLLVQIYQDSLRSLTTGEAGFDLALECVGDGLAALDRIESNTHFDLVITDLILPGIDGYDLILKLRAHDVLRKIPIVVISSSNVDFARLRQAGVEVVLRKPIRLEQIVSTVRTLLRLPNVEAVPVRVADAR